MWTGGDLNLPCVDPFLYRSTVADVSFKWFDEQDIQQLDNHYILAVTKKGGTPMLLVYDVSSVASARLIREYELPETWKTLNIGFASNTSPPSDSSASSDALFYPAPETRVVLITATSPSRSSYQIGGNWLFIKESYFKYQSRKGGLRVSWSQLAQSSVIRDLGNTAALIRGPYIVGARVVYLEMGHGRTGARIHSIDFAPFSSPSAEPRGPWVWTGPSSFLVPSDTVQTIPPSTLDGLPVEDIRVTEDNIVLFFVSLSPKILVN